jgi:hypothetical protein
MRVFVLVADHGDGTAGVKLYDGRVYTDAQITELIDNSPDYLGSNEGYAVWTFPDDFDFEAHGMRLITRK